MDIEELKTPQMPPVAIHARDGMREELLSAHDVTSIRSSLESKESVIQPADDVDGMFTHAPVSLWEEDFSEVKRRFDQLKSNGVADLRKHFKKNPGEVLALARMVRIVRINKQTLSLYEAAGPVEFRQGLSPIFNRDSFEVFREELIAFWKGGTSFTSEAVNLTLTGTSKNILIHAIIPPGYEQTWAKVYIAITDITAIRDSIKNLAASEQKYRSLFEKTQGAIVLVDEASGMIVEANRSAKRLFSVTGDELVGLHIADLLDPGEQKVVRALLSNQAGGGGLSAQNIHVRHKSSGAKILVMMTANTIEDGDPSIIALSFAQETAAAPVKRRGNDHHAPLLRKLSQRECEILMQICSGNTSRTIAQNLSISEKTVRTHRTRIMQKLDMHCVADLVKFSMETGLSRLS
jgi:PAS domain S-box-containing protein